MNKSVSHPRSTRVTAARAAAQRAKLNRTQLPHFSWTRAARRPVLPLDTAIANYLQDQQGGNQSPKTVQWHQTALGLFQQYLASERNTTQVDQIASEDVSAWLASLRTTPTRTGKLRSAYTIQTYARSARAFCHWLVRREYLEQSPFAQVRFPKVGKPLIRILEPEEFAALLQACTPPEEIGPLADRAAARNRAILWLLYDTGIRVSELCALRVESLDRRHGILLVKGKGAKERRIALGRNCQRHVSYYLDCHRPSEEELAAWGSEGEDHLFLSETRLPLTSNGMTLLFARLKKRAGITGKRVSPHILRHTFAVRYLQAGGDPFSLQQLLGHEDLATVKLYIHFNDQILQDQKRKYSPGDHLPTGFARPQETIPSDGSRKKTQRKY